MLHRVWENGGGRKGEVREEEERAYNCSIRKILRSHGPFSQRQRRGVCTEAHFIRLH